MSPQEREDEIVKRLRAVMRRWPAGMMVWRRADGRRGIVDGHMVCGDGSVLPRVSYGGAADLSYPFELNPTPVPENGDSEEWKLDDGNGDTKP